MTEETKKSNTCGLIWMIFSIIWLFLCITIVWTFFWRFFLFIWFVLGLIWLFSKPRWKAIAAVIIPIIVRCFHICAGLYIWSEIKPSFINFTTRFEEELSKEEYKEMLDDEKFNTLLQNNCQNLDDKDIESLRNNTEGNNIISKTSNLILWHIKDCFIATIEEYQTPVEVAVEQEESEVKEVTVEDVEEVIEKKEEVKQTSNTFSAEELKEIDDFLDILE